MISALCEAGFYFGEPAWVEKAELTANKIWDKCIFDNNRLRSVLYGDEATFNGYLDDYASYAHALLSLASKIDWISPGKSSGYIEKAETILESVTQHFKDPDSTGYFFTSDDHEDLVRRSKDVMDNAVPCGNSILLHCFSEAHNLTGRWLDEYTELS